MDAFKEDNMERTCDTCKWGFDSHPDEPCKWCGMEAPSEWVGKDTITLPRERLREALANAHTDGALDGCHVADKQYADRILAELEGEHE